MAQQNWMPVVNKQGKLNPKGRNIYGTSGLIYTGDSTTAGQLPFSLDTTYKIKSLTELEVKYGVTQNYDVAKNTLFWYQVSEFFRLAGDGTELYIMAVYHGEAMADYQQHIKDMLRASNYTIRQMAIGRVPASSYGNGTYIDDDVALAINLAQTEAIAAYEAHYPLHFFVEGRGLKVGLTSLSVLDDLTPLNANKVSVVIAQDVSYVSIGLPGIGNNPKLLESAAIGTALGTLAGRQLHERISKTANGNIYSSNYRGAKRWAIPGFSNGEYADVYTADYQDLQDKHYVFAHAFPNFAGVYWHKGYTCTVETDPEHDIAFGKVLDESARIIYASLLAYWDSDHLLNGDGTMTEATIDEIEEKLLADWAAQIGKSASNLAVTIDTSSDLINPPQQFKVAYELQPKGYMGTISATLTFVTTL